MQIISNSLEQQWMPFTANRAFKADPRIVVQSEVVHLRIGQNFAALFEW